VDTYALTLFCVGAAVLGASLLPLLLADRPLSFPIVYVALGMGIFALPIDLPSADPIEQGFIVEHLTELVVIVSLMGAGLKLDRPPSWGTWLTTRRLILIALPVTVAATALAGWWVAGLVPASALLLGAALAPTDPVLASEVQVGPPGGDAEDEDDVRFALTSEAGINDAMAFPFTNAAIAMAAAGTAGVGSWIDGWVLDDVVVKLSIGLAMGIIGGRLLGALLFRLPSTRSVAESTEGFVALAATLLVYGAAELAHGYGFLSVFVAACVIRNHERDHEYHEVLHASAEGVERLLSGILLVLLGGAVIDGVLAPVGPREIAVAALVLLVIRPVIGWVSLLRTRTPRRERWAIAFFGIRGMGSVYYLAHAMETETFEATEQLWAIVALTIIGSVVLHGTTAAPTIARLDDQREGRRARRKGAARVAA
jgi:NhaP-type Na+/H+ or K+/H+ antiporter